MKVFWLLEASLNGTPIYIHKENYRTTIDPYMAKRFNFKDDALVYMKEQSLDDQSYTPIEHGFMEELNDQN